MKRIISVSLIALSLGLVPGLAAAQGGANQGQAQQLMQDYRQKAEQLQQIHQETIDSNPELAQQQQEFEQKVRNEVENQGYDVENGQQRIQDMAQQLQSQDLSDQERQALMQDFQAERQQMVQARDAALEQPEIQEAGEQLQEDTMAAMKRQNGNAEQLLEDMESLRGQLREQMPAAGGGNR